MTEKKPHQGAYFPYKGQSPIRVSSPGGIRRASSPKRVGSPQRASSPNNFVDRRQSVKQHIIVEEKKPEIIEVVKTIKYEPEPDYES